MLHQNEINIGVRSFRSSKTYDYDEYCELLDSIQPFIVPTNNLGTDRLVQFILRIYNKRKIIVPMPISDDVITSRY